MAQLVVDAVATAITGGGYAGAILVALASSAAGMGMKEVMLGEDYELLDGDNAIELAASVAGAVVAKKYSNLFEEAVGGKAAVEALDRVGTMKAAAIEKTGEIIGETSVNMAFAERLPTEDEILAKAGDILVKLGSSSAGKGAGWSPQADLASRAATVRKYVLGNLTKNGVEVTGTAAVTALKTGGIGSGTGLDFAEALTIDLFKKSLKTFTNAVADAKFPDQPDGWGAGTGLAKDLMSEDPTGDISGIKFQPSDIQ